MTAVIGPGERIIKRGRAKFDNGAGPVAGMLYLTNLRVVFEVKRGRAQNSIVDLTLPSVRAVRTSRKKFFNLFSLGADRLSLVAFDGKEYHFVVRETAPWSDAIVAQISV